MGFAGAFRSAGWLIGAFAPVGAALLVTPKLRAQTIAPSTAGEQLFLSRCSSCHGVGGKGGSAYRMQLSGNLTAAQLSAFVAKSMPPGPKKCPASEAARIADYMVRAFYSQSARAKLKPPRVALAHLTVRQFRNAVTDLISGWHGATPDPAVHGLNAEYFKGRSRDGANRVIQRVDPDVRFDFGTEAPAKDGFDPRNFSIAWQGSVLAPDTGDYEFSIHSRHSCQLWLNDSRYPVVDGEVRSAGDVDPHGTVTLLGGRAYNLYMVFTKATQGVSDADKKNQAPSGPSYVTLQWRRPHHIAEPIPTQFLYPRGVPKLYVVSSQLPPDDRSMGFEKGDSVSKEWDDATVEAALEASDYVKKNLSEVTGVSDKDDQRAAKLQQFCVQFVARAFRRPLTDDQKKLYIEKQFAATANLSEAVKRVVFLSLISPRFLYREIGGPSHDSYTVASQLSFGLWDSIPDPQLEQAADKNLLASKEQLESQADRMVTDNRTWDKLRQFLLLWLKIDEVPDIVKDPKLYPDFDSAVASDLRTSLELYLQNTAWDKSADYRNLMLSGQEFFNGRLAKIYGISLPADAPFEPVSAPNGDRTGLISQPYLLSRFAYLGGSDPIHRGVLIYRNLLGRILSPPPANFAPLAASFHPDMTTRQRVAFQTKPQFCNNCHGIINPLGFTLEEYDAIGRRRQLDNAKSVDASGFYRATDGSTVTFKDSADLAKYLANSDDARTAFITKLFLNVAKSPPAAYGSGTLDRLKSDFAKDDCDIRKLLVDMAISTAEPSK